MDWRPAFAHRRRAGLPDVPDRLAGLPPPGLAVERFAWLAWVGRRAPPLAFFGAA